MNVQMWTDKFRPAQVLLRNYYHHCIDILYLCIIRSYVDSFVLLCSQTSSWLKILIDLHSYQIPISRNSEGKLQVTQYYRLGLKRILKSRRYDRVLSIVVEPNKMDSWGLTQRLALIRRPQVDIVCMLWVFNPRQIHMWSVFRVGARSGGRGLSVGIGQLLHGCRTEEKPEHALYLNHSVSKLCKIPAHPS